MNKKTHKKHTSLQKPALGEFGRNELAILGTPCGNIKNLSRQIIRKLGKKYNISYVDADHKSADEGLNRDHLISDGGSKLLTDKIDYLQVDWKGNKNTFQQKKLFIDQDMILVNGNHFVAANQIVVIDPKKPLDKKLHKLNNVRLILTMGSEPVPDYLKDHLNVLPFPPVKDVNDVDAIAEWIGDFMQSKTPPLHGLVLAGGKSERMNTDKGLLKYHGIPQREYAWNLLNDHCIKTYTSCREDQISEIGKEFNPLPDSFSGLGPFGGILSAFRHQPNVAWLTVAADLPLLDKEIIESLIQQRNISKIATAYWDPKHEFPEPLITIWEPRAYSELLHFLSLGYSCPRKTLINSDVELIEATDTSKLMNVNYPEEYDKVMEKLGIN